MLRTHHCNELTLQHLHQQVTLSAWVKTIRDKGKLIFIDLRDKFGITQIRAEEGKSSAEVLEVMRSLGREFVVQVIGRVIERTSKNPDLATGDIEVEVEHIQILNPAKLPPFLIEDQTDGGEDLRMKYRYLDLRRNPVRQNIELRHRMAQATRRYLDSQGFIEVETPILIKSTPEGARDFVVPSRINQGEFYALPQSPQTFKQLLMVAGLDRYFQIVKCFRDEDLRADRQPEFTQIDCEMSFVTQEDILQMFEGLVHFLFQEVKGINIPPLMRIPYSEAMRLYGSDKPDTRFGMPFVELNHLAKNKGFQAFDSAELVVGICAKGCADYTRKQLDELTDFVKKPQIGSKGLVYVKCQADGTFKSSVDKFYTETDLKQWAEAMQAQAGDLLLVLSGETAKVRKQLNELRLEMGNRLGLRNKDSYSCLWVTDFPLLEYNQEDKRYYAMHHPFTSPKPEDIPLLQEVEKYAQIRANAYDMVINGVEVGGGSIRIYQRPLQEQMLQILGFSAAEAQAQFGFLMEAFEFGAPPHGGIAFGFDRLCSLFGGADSIRDFIAFPKNNAGRDVMINSPSNISPEQLAELGIALSLKGKY